VGDRIRPDVARNHDAVWVGLVHLDPMFCALHTKPGLEPFAKSCLMPPAAAGRTHPATHGTD